MKRLIKLVSLLLVVSMTCAIALVGVTAEEIEEELFYYGDLNYDGKVTMEDVTTLQKILAMLDDGEITVSKQIDDTYYVMSPIPVTKSDLAGMQDVVLMQRFIAGLINEFPVGVSFSWGNMSHKTTIINDTPQNTDTEETDWEKYDVPDVKVDSDEYSHLFDVSLDLFKMGLSETENTLVSPLSIVLAMSAATNGADGETLKEMAKYLTGYDDMEQYNILLKALQERFVTDDECLKFSIANSMWVKDDEELFTVNEDYKDKLKDVFSAEIFTEDFSDSKTVDKINGWIDENTFGMIKKMIEKLNKETIILLINAIAFEARWDNPYGGDYESSFTTYSGETKKSTFMSEDMYSYVCDSDAQGFIKKYWGNKYSFAAILPNKNVDVLEYAEKMTGEHFRELMATHTTKYYVQTKLPAFKYSYNLSYKEPLEKVMPLAFDKEKANLKKMLTFKKPEYNAFISDVVHSTFIELTKDGTKAAAATVVSIDCETCCEPKYDRKVLIDRPFMYAIIDNETKLPIFMGVVLDV
ncbi:MAG: hypothetical protein K6F76_05690 [Clostridiales bacterium]|nr:hypothetical protein [Clostridiales bacterium]